MIWIILSVIKGILIFLGLVATFYHLFRGFVQQVNESKTKAAKTFFGTFLIVSAITVLEWAFILY